MNKLVLISIFLLKNIILLSQNTPLSIAKLVFSNKPPQNISQFSVGEYQQNKSRPTGKDFDKKVKKAFLVLEENDTTAVINMTLTDKSKKSLDTYIHFVREDNKWKIEAFRSLALTGMFEEMLEEMKKMSPSTLDTLIQKGDLFKSKEDFELYKFNLELILSSDKKLIEHFNRNKEKFENLKNKINSTTNIDTTKAKILPTDYGKNFEKEIKILGLNRVTNRLDNNDECENCTNLNFIIGGMSDNKVGYFYIPDEAYLPEMSANNFIMIRKIANNWYIYKTT